MTLEKIKKALSDYNEIVTFVDKYVGSLNDLFERLIGHNLNLEEGTFDVNHKSINASIYTNMGCYYVSGNIEVYDDEKGTMTRMFVNDMRELIQKAEDDDCGAYTREYQRVRNKVHHKCHEYLRGVLKGRTKKMLELTDSLSVFANGKWCVCYSIVLDDCNIVRLELGQGNLCAIYDLDMDSTLNLWGKVRDMVTSTQSQQEQKEVRVKFSASVYIKGENMRDIRQKWENCELLPKDTDDVCYEFDERLLVEDAESYEDVSREFDDHENLMYER